LSNGRDSGAGNAPRGISFNALTNYET
jgi:hypothetical protein